MSSKAMLVFSAVSFSKTCNASPDMKRGTLDLFLNSGYGVSINRSVPWSVGWRVCLCIEKCFKALK